MHIESVRALKIEVAERIVRPLIAEAWVNRRFGIPARPAKRLGDAQRGVALGIAKGRNGRDYRLAVRIQRRLLESAADLRERIERAARREVEVRYVGRVGKQAADAPVPWHRARQRPLLIGSSIGHYAVTAGTLGGFATQRKTGRAVILSNNHVLADEDRARKGDPILQPGVYDGGRRTKDRVGTLLAAVALKPRRPNLVDAAIATIDERVRFDPLTLTGLGRLRGVRQAPIDPGDSVVKLGRTTGLTRGVVTAIELDDVVVEYDRGSFRFDGQIEIEGAGDSPFSAGGDSGSLILDAQGYAFGLLFAGSDQGGSNGKGLTNANDLSDVLRQLNLALAIEAPLA